jgi:hypothetical protein
MKKNESHPSNTVATDRPAVPGVIPGSGAFTTVRHWPVVAGDSDHESRTTLSGKTLVLDLGPWFYAPTVANGELKKPPLRPGWRTQQATA